MKLAFQAIDQTGRAIADTVEANDEFEATEILHRRGLFVSEIAPAKGKSKSQSQSGGFRMPQTKGRQLKLLATFLRNLHVLMASGTQLAKSLLAIERQTIDPRWKTVFQALRTRIEEGSSFADALGEHPKYFDPITCSMVAAGETSGNLELMLDRLAGLKQKQLKIRRQVVGALTYPLLVVIVAAGVLNLLIGVVLPRFSEMFTVMKVPLPPTTRLLMMGGDFMRAYWWAVIPTVITFFIAMWRYVASEHGGRVVDTLLIRLPMIGSITRSFITARVVRLLGVLLGSHVSLLEALKLASNASGNMHYAQLLDTAGKTTAMGNSLSSAFDQSDLISPSVYESLHNGEQSGMIDRMLLTVADFMDEDNEVILNSILSILAPAILAVLGVFVGFVAVSLFLPLFDLTAASADGGVP